MPWTDRQPLDPVTAFARATGNKLAIKESDYCGCYQCLTNNIDPTKITTYVDDKEGGTALCPHCGIDSIIPNSPTDADLQAAHDVWFKES